MCGLRAQRAAAWKLNYSQISRVAVRCGAHIASAGYSKDCSIANLKTTVERRKKKKKKKKKKKASPLLIGGIDDKNHMIFYVSIYLHRMPNLCFASR